MGNCVSRMIANCCNRVFGCLCSLVMFGIMGYILWNFVGRPDLDEALDAIKNFDIDDFTNVLGNVTLEDIMEGFNQDPYVGDNSMHAWKTVGEGLSLELQNALDGEWHSEFVAAVNDWQEADALTLTTTKVDVDHTCQPVDGVMKVCNGNYGPTGWLGINEVELEYITHGGRLVQGDNGYIVSSVAKMNEYYLHNAGWEERLYTMCHEIGHGFGLPHTDENPNNRDLGDCMDYTTTPQNNLHPGEVNFQKLSTLYLQEQTSGWNNNPANTNTAVAAVAETRTASRNSDSHGHGMRGTRRLRKTYYFWVQ